MKILINCPNINIMGGVANHYLGLKPYWNENVKYNYTGSRGRTDGIYAIIGRLVIPYDIVKFIMKLICFNPDVVLLNPSLASFGMTRDMFYLRIAKVFRKKVFVFIHGWKHSYEEQFFQSNLFNTLCKADGILVLANEFKQKLVQNGYKRKVYLTTTKVDDRMTEDFNINEKTGKIENILFLARVEKEKGIYETIDSFSILKKKYPYLNLFIVGDGSEITNIKDYISRNNIDSITLTGMLRGEQLVEIFKKSDIYLFPTFHGEGMPTSILESMAFGLPIVTRPVGGTKDFFDENMGFITESLEPKVYADAIEQYINDSEKTLATSRYNYRYAKEHFMASKVAKSIEDILKQ